MKESSSSDTCGIVFAIIRSLVTKSPARSFQRSWLSVERPTRFSPKFLGCLYSRTFNSLPQVVKSGSLSRVQLSRYTSLALIRWLGLLTRYCLFPISLTGLSPRSSSDDTISIAHLGWIAREKCEIHTIQHYIQTRTRAFVHIATRGLVWDSGRV